MGGPAPRKKNGEAGVHSFSDSVCEGLGPFLFFSGVSSETEKGKPPKKKCGGFPENRHPRCWVSPQQQTRGVDLFDWGQSGERKGPGQASREGSKERLQRGFRLGILLACPFARVGTFVAAVAKRNERETTFVGHV